MKKPEIERTLTIDFYSEQPKGLRAATLGPTTMGNWPGRLVLAPRKELGAALKLFEQSEALSESGKVADTPGVYFLIAEDGPKPRLYIGRTDTLKVRIQQHDHTKSWWEQIIAVSSTDSNLRLTESETRYLEFKLFQRAKEVDRVEIEGGKQPSPGRISDRNKVSLNSFYNGLLQIFSLLRIDYLNDQTPSGHLPVSSLPTRFDLVLEIKVPTQTRIATGKFNKNGTFVVLSGSAARRRWVGTSSGRGNKSPQEIYHQLRRNGTLVPDGSCCQFTKDNTFSSLSSAASVIIGTAANGRLHWTVRGKKNSAGRPMTYKEYEEQNSPKKPRRVKQTKRKSR